MAKSLDVVRLTDGRTATILEVVGDGSAYIVEFSDKDGRSTGFGEVMAKDVSEVLYKSGEKD